MEIATIEDSVTLNVNYPSVSERYFEHYYFIPRNIKKKTIFQKTDIDFLKNKLEALPLGKNEPEEMEGNSYAHFKPSGNDTHVMMHSNRICVVGLSHKHPILVEGKKVTKVDFSVDGMDRLSNKISGKGKRGAQIIGCFSPICQISCSDASTYIILAGTRGKLVEVNQRLVTMPHLLTEFPSSDGYLAVVLPRIPESEKVKKLLLSPEDYEEVYNVCDD